VKRGHRLQNHACIPPTLDPSSLGDECRGNSNEATQRYIKKELNSEQTLKSRTMSMFGLFTAQLQESLSFPMPV
jgi:hypothetical protein